MAKASFTRNMDTCVVEENEVINTSQKYIYIYIYLDPGNH